jgi:hypothetical protein
LPALPDDLPRFLRELENVEHLYDTVRPEAACLLEEYAA